MYNIYTYIYLSVNIDIPARYSPDTLVAQGILLKPHRQGYIHIVLDRYIYIYILVFIYLI